MFKRLSFAGVTGLLRAARPSAYDEMLERHGHTDIGGFSQLLQTLDEQYSIAARPAMYGSNTDDGVLPAHRHKVLVNPAWEGEDDEDIPGDRVDAVWNIPGQGYAVVAHDSPLDQLRQAVGDRYDSSEVFGVTRLRREGAEMHTDLFAADNLMDDLGGDELYLGISTGHDYTSTTRLYVDVVGLLIPEDGNARILRYLIEPRKRKHTGDAEDEVVTWYGDALDRLDTVSDKLYRVIGDAMHHEIDLSDYPCTMQQFYSHLGLPSSRNDLATPAARNTRTMSLGTDLTAWHTYKGGMRAIEDEYDSRDTSAYKNHVNTVNTLLFNPSLAEKRVLSSVEESIVEARESDDDETEATDITEWAEADSDDPLETVRTRAKSISEGVAEFESTRERVRALLNDEGTEEAESDEVARAEADD